MKRHILLLSLLVSSVGVSWGHELSWPSSSTQGDACSEFNLRAYYPGGEFDSLCVGSEATPLKLTVRCKGRKSAMNQLVGTFTYTADSITQTVNVTYDALNRTSTIPLPKARNLTIDDNAFTTYKGYTLTSHNFSAGTLTLNYRTTDARYLFQSQGKSGDYRIPAITQAHNGDLIAFSDNRPQGGWCDVGMGHVDLVMRISKDNGRTWGPETMVADGTGLGEDANCGYGDAAIVADRNSSHVVMMSCMAPNPGTCWTEQQRSVIYWSRDNGRTWSAPKDIKDEIRAKFEAKGVKLVNYFVGAGKLCQSRRIKVGEFYRIYAALWTYNGSSINNYVIYSDDFGHTWDVLGTATSPGPNGNEPKVEELPNGNVLLSARKPYGRLINIFTYDALPTKATPAQGSWATSVDGAISVDDGANGTNGEVLIVYAKKRGSRDLVPIALQSAPGGSGRTKVSIWYKILDEASDYDTPEHYKEGWTKGLQVCDCNSAYSTMTLQKDGRIGFFYEDSQSGAVYDMIYIPLTLEEIGIAPL